MKVLVTGGLGFIGSHTVIDLVQAGHQVVVVDNDSSGIPNARKHIEALTDGQNIKFITCDISKDYLLLRGIFSKEHFDAIVHLAASKSVVESMMYPDVYYENNVKSTQDIVQLAVYFKVPKMVFSSSAAVYPSSSSPCIEDFVFGEDAGKCLSVYGQTKVLNEKDLKSIVSCIPNASVTIFRYFNVIGGHNSGLLNDESTYNIVPNIIRSINHPGRVLSVYKSPSYTFDGTCIRDYVHVEDVAQLNADILNKETMGYNIYNVGSGIGVSTGDLIKMFEHFSEVSIPTKYLGSRDGDRTFLVADISKIKKELGWTPIYILSDMVYHALHSCPTYY